jgi:hypothetical protein
VLTKGKFKRVIRDKYAGALSEEGLYQEMLDLVDEARKEFPEEKSFLNNVKIEWAHEKWCIAVREWFVKWFGK